MTRSWPWLTIAGLCALGCGPDQRECTGPNPDFVVTLRLHDRTLPSDTVVHVTYGGSGMESYDLQSPGTRHEVVFCDPGNADCSVELDAGSVGAAGASGSEDSGVPALCCELYTGGFATLQVSATGLAAMTYDLTPREHVCPVKQTIVLDSPDGG